MGLYTIYRAQCGAINPQWFQQQKQQSYLSVVQHFRLGKATVHYIGSMYHENKI